MKKEMSKTKKLLVIFILILSMTSLSGCNLFKRYYGNKIESNHNLNIYSEEIRVLKEMCYITYLEKIYIIVDDEFGVTQYVPIIKTIPQNTYNLDNLVTEGEFKYYYENNNITSKVGIDVSKYQGYIDWTKVKAAGVDFAFIRLGYRGYGNGKLVVDDYFNYNLKNATAAGIDVGIYFFTQAISVEEAEEEAQFVVDNIGEYKITYPIVFDTESVDGDDARANNLDQDLRTDICIGFCEKIKVLGYNPMVYGNRRWFALKLDYERIQNYDIWFAQYNEYPKFPYEFQIWQFTQTGVVDGIDKPVDINISFKDYGEGNE